MANLSSHWVDQLTCKVVDQSPKQHLILGLELSKSWGIGAIREILTADYICRTLKGLNYKCSLNVYSNSFDVEMLLEPLSKKLGLDISFVDKLSTKDISLSIELINLSINNKQDSLINNCKCICFQTGTVRVSGHKLSIRADDKANGTKLLSDLLEIYEPEIIRWIFAKQNYDQDITIKLDEGVIRTYNLFDKDEQLAYSDAPKSPQEAFNEKYEIIKRTYELSQISFDPPVIIPFQPMFSKITNILQIYELDISKAYASNVHLIKNDRDKRRFTERAQRALFWIENHAPEHALFSICKNKHSLQLSVHEKNFIKKVYNFIQSDLDDIESNIEIDLKLSQLGQEEGLEQKYAYTILYQIIIKKEHGPPLAELFHALDRNDILMLLSI